jgi:hypothetical protein
MTCTPLPPELAALCARAQRACDGMAAACATLEKTCGQTEQVIAEARQIHPISWCASADHAIAPARTAADRDSYEAAHEAVYAIRDILDEFPLRWQIAIVKALGVRAAVLAQQRQQLPSVLSA